MSDSTANCSANLRNYQIQLQQVEAALITDSNNNELNKLKNDLMEVIALTKQLMTSDGEKEENISMNDNIEYNDIEISHHFEAGDLCLAPLSEDGQFYEAKIEDLTSDGQCTVVFNTNNRRKVSEVCLVSLLKPIGRKKVKLTSINSQIGLNEVKVKKQLMLDQKDHLKKKQLKKKERLKELEEEREKDKLKWQSFSNKAYQKHLKGATKKSIFASPDSVAGKVGVGTCGVGGKPMTEFTHAEKWKRAAGSSGSIASHSRYAHNYRYK